jgi:hypothetical protein
MDKSAKFALLLVAGLLGACDGDDGLSEGDFYRICAEKVENKSREVAATYRLKGPTNHGIIPFSDAKSDKLYLYKEDKDKIYITALFKFSQDVGLGYLNPEDQNFPLVCIFVKEGSGWRLQGLSKL